MTLIIPEVTRNFFVATANCPPHRHSFIRSVHGLSRHPLQVKKIRYKPQVLQIQDLDYGVLIALKRFIASPYVGRNSQMNKFIRVYYVCATVLCITQ